MMTIIPRSEWGARYAAGAGPAPLPAREVWLHHSVTIAPDLLPPFDDDNAAMRTLEAIGQSRFKQGISYTFAITPVGRIHEGHGVGTLGAHTAKRNGIARAICWIGNYDVTAPTPQLIESTAQLLVHGKRSGWWVAARLNGGHQNAPGASTTCPGRHAMAVIPEINARAAAIEAGASSLREPDPVQEDDMPQFIAAAGRGHALVWPGFVKLLPGGPAGQEELDHARTLYGEIKSVPTRSFDVIVALHMNTSFSGQATVEIAASVAKAVSGADVDEQAIIQGLAPVLAARANTLTDDDLNRLKTAVADELDRRSRDGDPATGPVS